jgi:hypothetical protein
MIPCTAAYKLDGFLVSAIGNILRNIEKTRTKSGVSSGFPSGAACVGSGTVHVLFRPGVKYMKKLMSKKNVYVAASALVGMAAMVQACGSGSGSGTAPVAAAACTLNSLGQCISTTTTANSALYEACSSVQQAQIALEESGINAQVLGGVPSTSTDGTPVCMVTMVSQSVYMNGGEGPRQFLGLSAPGYSGVNTGIQVSGYDLITVQGSGTSSSGTFSGFSGCGSAIPTGTLDAFVQGMYAPVQISLGQITVPAIGGGYLLVGLDETPGSSGCMTLAVQATIERCVDSTGLSHPCP